ncbi:MAG TPA: cation transporter [Acidimicrobiia bacterium]|nr:cation transporter [Acidimicrobiia bacterium]
MDDHESDGRGFSRLTRLRHQFGHVLSHDHDHAPAPAVLDTGAVGIRATKVSLAGLGITALIQAVIVVVSGSVALLSDTIHNLTDALTAFPLWIAFAVGRRPATKRYTYGFNRAEDWAGHRHRHRHRPDSSSGSRRNDSSNPDSSTRSPG